MRVKELIKELEKFDGELPVCLFYESWCHLVEHFDIRTYTGVFKGQLGHKMINTEYNEPFVALNDLGDFVNPDNYPRVCPIKR
jgi:hypothetical protein